MANVRELQAISHSDRTFVLTLGNKQRFQRTRDVGCNLGLETTTQSVR